MLVPQEDRVHVEVPDRLSGVFEPNIDTFARLQNAKDPLIDGYGWHKKSPARVSFSRTTPSKVRKRPVWPAKWGHFCIKSMLVAVSVAPGSI